MADQDTQIVHKADILHLENSVHYSVAYYDRAMNMTVPT